MPNYHDAMISDIIVTVDETPQRSFDQVMDEIKQAGAQIREVHKDQCTLEATVDYGKVATIDNLPGVDYVRTVFTYVADFPPGDPRDLDNASREAD